MRKLTLLLSALLALTLAAGPARAQAPPKSVTYAPGRASEIRITGTFEVAPNKLIRLAAEGVPDKTGVLWEVYPDDLADIARTTWDRCEFAGPPGKYRVSLLVIEIDAQGRPIPSRIRQTVTILSAGPVPPDPTPPVPPKPGPDAAWLKSVKDAYALDTGAEKANHVTLLMQVYLKANPGDHKTVGDLWQALKKISLATLPPEAIPNTRRALGAGLDARLPTTPDAPVDVEKTKKAFEDAVTILKAVVK